MSNVFMPGDTFVDNDYDNRWVILSIFSLNESDNNGIARFGAAMKSLDNGTLMAAPLDDIKRKFTRVSV